MRTRSATAWIVVARSLLTVPMALLSACGPKLWDKWRAGSPNAAAISPIAANNRVQWSHPNGNHMSSGAVTDGGSTLIFNASGRKVLSVDANTGAVKHTFVTPDEIFSAPAIDNHVVYVGCNDGRLYALDAGTLTKIWDAPTGGRINSSPLAIGDRVYVGSEDGKVYAFNTADGKIAWTHATGGPVLSSPAIGKDAILYIQRHSAALAAGNRGGPDRIFFGNEIGEFFLYEANMSFARALVASTDLQPGEATASPVATTDGQSAIVGNGRTLLRLTVQPGTSSTGVVFNIATIHAFQSIFIGSPSVNHDGTIFIGDGDGLFAIR